MTVVVTDEPLIDGWRAGWLIPDPAGRWAISSPFRGPGMNTQNALGRILWGESRGNPHPAEWAAVCFTRPDEKSYTGLPVDHVPPHPDCFCGIHATDRLQHLRYIVESMRDFALHAAKYGPLRAGIVLYRVALIGEVLESAMYRHAPKADGRGLWGDPPNTWRAGRARVVGPVIVPPGVDIWGVSLRYGEPVLRGLSDAVESCDALADAQPRTRGTVCRICRHLNDHATECPDWTGWPREALDAVDPIGDRWWSA